jgi:fucose permease
MPISAAGIITTILLICSAFSSFISGKVLSKFGTGKVTFISCTMTGLALLGYSQVPSFAWLVLLAIPLGLGQGAVDSGLNNYVANNYTSRHMSWLHCFWGVGATLGPYIMTKTVAADLTWREGYRNISIIQIILAVILLLSLKLWKVEKVDSKVEEHVNEQKAKNSSLKSLAPWLAVLMFFIYVGTEFSVGLWANSLLVESRNIPKATAGLWISYYYGSLMFGRFLTGIVVNKLGNRNLIRLGLIIAVTGVVLVYLPFSSVITMLGLMLIGFGFAPIYPCMMHETPTRFNEETSNALIGYQVGAACLGGSAISSGLGLLFAAVSLELLLPALAILLISMILISEYLNRTT